ncbi:MAG: potassium transporter TrkG [Pseudorhodobacter sp.]|nr:potassium transporter TrkG [Pseudorhodobacter sp.]
MKKLLELPFLVILTGIGALAMYIPAAHAVTHDMHEVARPFFYGGTVFLLLTVMVGIATSNYRPENVARSQLAALLGAYLWLPIMFAVPLDQAVKDTSFFNAWFEMVSSFTTTGATLYDTPGRLPPSIHLWRALVGWLGGFFVLVTAVAVLAPLNLGGVEVVSGRVPGRGAPGLGQISKGADPSERLVRYTLSILPVYLGLTVALWMLLVISGDRGLVALVHAMSSLSTSGITFGPGLSGASSGLIGEMLIFGFMALALTRRSFPAPSMTDREKRLTDDHEVRLAAVFLTVVPTILFFRHWVGALVAEESVNLPDALLALWGGLFTTMSFLTTTGFESAHWQAARAWSGLGSPGLILLGLAMMGGGIATTAGGLKLLRIYALARHGERELDRLVHPNSIGGQGDSARRLRRGGAYISWIFFMLYAFTFAVVVALLSLCGLEFEPSLVLTVAAVTTTGPLATLAAETPIRLLELAPAVKLILAVAMVVGRMEILAILALLAPGVWRR